MTMIISIMMMMMMMIMMMTDGVGQRDKLPRGPVSWEGPGESKFQKFQNFYSDLTI